MEEERKGSAAPRTLDAQQAAAANILTGPLMVIACAGSGKTTVLLERAHNLILQGADPSRIMAVTFSRNGAAELSNRYRAQYDAAPIRFSTIHSLCYRILAERYGKGKLVFFTNEELRAFLQGVRNKYRDFYAEMLESGDSDIQKELQNRMSHTALQDYYQEPIDHDDTVWKIWQDYRRLKAERREIDFDDLVFMAHRTLTREPETLRLWQNRYDYLMIDEFQDTSRLQADIFFLLAKPHRNICVVGDDDQSIYGFRDADPEIFRRFMKEYPDAKRVTIATNYRSLPGIVERASSLIAHNRQRYRKDFRVARKGRADIRIVSERTNASQSADTVGELKADFAAGRRPGDIAILYRNRRSAMGSARSLYEAGIPFTLSEDLPDLSKGQVYRNLSCYRRLSLAADAKMINGDDIREIINRPNRYISPQAIPRGMQYRGQLYKACLDWAAKPFQKKTVHDNLDELFADLDEMQGMSPKEFINYLNYGLSYYDFLEEHARYLHLPAGYFQQEFDVMRKMALSYENIEAWLSGVRDWNARLHDYCEACRKTAAAGGDGAVTLSTFHAAKGLQWKKVYIISADYVDESERTPAEREEERRLFYVAMTRAEDALSIVHTGPPVRYIKESGAAR